MGAESLQNMSLVILISWISVATTTNVGTQQNICTFWALLFFRHCPQLWKHVTQNNLQKTARATVNPQPCHHLEELAWWRQL